MECNTDGCRGVRRVAHGRTQKRRETPELTLCARGIELTDEDRRCIVGARTLATRRAWLIDTLAPSQRAEAFQNA